MESNRIEWNGMELSCLGAARSKHSLTSIRRSIADVSAETRGVERSLERRSPNSPSEID